MNIKKFMVIGLASLYACVGCGTAQGNAAQESVSSSVENSEEQGATTEENNSPQAVQNETETELVEEEPKVDETAQNNEIAKKQIQDVSSLIGKKAEEVDAILGEPVSVQNLEDTDILLVRYYRVPFFGDTAKIEVIFNDHEQVVNHVSFMVLKANDIASTKEIMVNVLTDLHGESTIERFLNVKGKQNRNWYDDVLTYELTYFDNNIALDIYPTDK